MGFEVQEVIKDRRQRASILADFFEVIVSIPGRYEDVVVNILRKVDFPIGLEYNVDS